jgi:hypothetical protein
MPRHLREDTAERWILNLLTLWLLILVCMMNAPPLVLVSFLLWSAFGLLIMLIIIHTLDCFGVRVL